MNNEHENIDIPKLDIELIAVPREIFNFKEWEDNWMARYPEYFTKKRLANNLEETVFYPENQTTDRIFTLVPRNVR